MVMMKYFALSVSLERNAPLTLFYQEEKNELYVGPHGRLSGLSGMAHIDSESLAKKYAEAIAPIIQKRYGNSSTVEVVTWSTTMDKKTILRVAKDSEIIKKRLKTKNFVSNKIP